MDNQISIENIKKLIGTSYDIKCKRVSLNSKVEISLIYIDGLANIAYISEFISKPLVENEIYRNEKDARKIIKLIDDGNLYFANHKISYDLNNTIAEILSGSTALIFDDCNTSIVFDTKGYEKRPITEQSTENIIKGPKDTFVETLNVNVATVRRRIKIDKLVIENITIGSKTKTAVAIVYIKDKSNDVLQEFKKRLNSINVESIKSSGDVETLINDDPSSLFPLLCNTERPDKFCANILEGNVGIIIDGFPIAYTAPATFVQFFQVTEDYTRKYIIGSVLRFSRFFMFLFSITFPGFFVSLISFHQEMIPSELALAISKTHMESPFSMLMEILLMLITFEILIEASLRLPKYIGPAVSIVGTLVIGQAAVEAKIVSPITVIIISLISIASFVMPNQDFSYALRLYRFVFVILGGLFGLFGIVLGFIFLIFRLSKAESFGVPYLYPLVSMKNNDVLRDTIFRFPKKNTDKSENNG